MKKSTIIHFLTVASFVIASFNLNAQVSVNIKAFLEGPFELTEMSTNLNATDSIPLNQPYFTEPWHYSVVDEVDFIPHPNIVDWVLVELLQAEINEGDTAYVVLGRKSAFILNDGTITDLDGVSNLSFPEIKVPEFYIKLIHRNHLPITSSTPLIKTGEIYNYDFTVSPGKAAGGIHSQNELASNIWGMIAGDGDHNGQIDNRDKDDVWLTEEGMTGYYDADYNLNGIVDESDLSFYWNSNGGKGAEQLIYADGFLCGDTLIDYRNGRQYETLQIEDQCWMTSNLNLGTMVNGGAVQSDNDVLEKYCYDNDTNNCITYGALYQWDEMMQYDSLEFNDGICPDGWHLPNTAEWEALIVANGGMTNAGSALVNSGFDALMNGQYTSAGGFEQLNSQSTFWTANGVLGAKANSFYILDGNPAMNSLNDSVYNAYGVRCLKGLPNRIDSTIRVIDTLVYKIISDSLELAQGVYRYEILGKQKSKDIIIADNIIVGDVEKGYLRKVDGVAFSGNEMTLNTSKATFEDIFVEGEFSLGSEVPGKKGLVYSSTEIIYLADGVEFNTKEGGFSYDFNNVIFYENEYVKVSAPQGHVTLNPNFDFDFKFKNRRVKRLAFLANNALFENSLDLQLDVTGAYSYNNEKVLAEVKHTKVFIIPAGIPIPVVIITTFQLKGILDFNFDGAFTATTGYKNTNTLSFGLEYSNGSWQKIWDFQKNNQLHPLSWNGNIAVNQGLTLVPEIDIEFYGVVGPYFNLPVWEELKANLALPVMDYDASIDIGLDGKLGADITIFGKTLSEYEKDLFGFKKNIYHSPSEMTMILGNNQTDTANTQLPLPITVNVTDNVGESYIPTRVHFTVETSDGTFSETDVWTDINGNAETYWTLGSLVGEQKIKAEVRKANGQNITGSPMEFIATATPAVFVPFITTTSISDITQTTATGGGEITDNGGSPVLARGVCWSTSPNPTVDSLHTNDGTGDGIFVSALNGLTEYTTYFVRAYATNSIGTGYGDEEMFTTYASTIYPANNPIPADGATGVSWNGSLSISPGDFTPLDAYYKIYLDTIPNPTTEYILNSGQTSFSYSDLQQDKEYYWKVETMSNDGIVLATSTIWWFTTLPENNYSGDITLLTQQEVDDFGANNYTEITGTLAIGEFGNNTNEISNLNSLSSLSSVSTLGIYNNNNLTNLNGLQSLTSISSTLMIYYNETLSSISQLNGIVGSLTGDLYIAGNANLVSLNGLNGISSIGGSLTLLNNTSLTDIGSLNNITQIIGNLSISGNNITNVNAFINLTSIGGGLGLNEDNLTDISGFANIQTIVGSIGLGSRYNNYNNQNLTNVTFNSLISCGGIGMSRMNNVTTISFPNLQTLGSLRIFINHEITSMNFSSLTTITGDVWISNTGLTLESFSSLTTIDGDVWLGEKSNYPYNPHPGVNTFETLNGLENLASINGSLIINDNNYLINLCALQNLFNNSGIAGGLYIGDNAFNPTQQDIIDGNCSQ